MPTTPSDDGPNLLTGSGGDDTILGLGGNDTLVGNGGRDLLDGGAGFDAVDFAGTAGDLDVNLDKGVETGVTDSALVSIEAALGGDGDDTIAGDGNSNWLDGGGGDDVVNGGDGSDTLLGGPGGNVIDGGGGEDILRYDWAPGAVLVNLADGHAEAVDPAGLEPAAVDRLSNIEHALGGAFDDTLIGSDGANFLAGVGGDDSVSGGAGDDTLFAGEGRDTLDGGDGFDTVDFTSATAALDANLATGVEGSTGGALARIEGVLGGSGADSITGDDGINWLDGRGGNDTIRGMEGSDTLAGGAGDNLLDGMGGADVVDYGWAGAGVAVDLAAGRATHGDGTDTIVGVEHVAGSAYNDTIAGDDSDNYLNGSAGNDDVSGGGGADTLAAGQGQDTLDGGEGYDIVDLAPATTGLHVNLGQDVEEVTGSVLLSIEGAVGGGFADHLDGDENPNWLDGRDGDDTIHGFESQDTLMGGLGANTIDGGEGVDVLRYDWMAGPVAVDLAAGIGVGSGVSDTLSNIEAVIGTAANDTITGGAEDNYLQGALGDDVLAGGAGNDTIASGDGRDTIDGGDGVDLVDFGAAAGAVFIDLGNGVEIGTGTVLTSIEAAIGSNFDDILAGDGANNWLYAGAGNDTLAGGRGDDTLIGGEGADIIVFGEGDGYDAVFGFQTGVDVIDATSYAAGNPNYQVSIFEYGSDLVIQFENGDNLYLVGTSFATFDPAADLRL